MSTPIYNPRSMGAVTNSSGTHFRVWAPFAHRIAVVGDFNQWDPARHLLQPENNGMWALHVPEAKAGDLYQFEISRDGQTFRKNDAYALAVHPEKRTSVICQDTYSWQHPECVLSNWNEMVIYELHVGTFASGPDNGPGQFEQVRKRLPYLKHLGVNAIELMPLAEFPSERSWGYNLTNPFAVEESYGGAEALKQLIDAAHGHGISVILDVVFNHFGPSDLDLWQYDGWSENGKGGIYFYNDHRSWTPWGDNRPDYGRSEVRQYIRDNVLYWLEVFHIDGLRFDSTLFIRNTRGDNSNPETDLPDGWSLLQWVNEEIVRHFPGRITIAEDLMQNHWLTKPTGAGGAGFCTQWDSAFVHPVRASVVQLEDAGRSMTSIAQSIEFRYNADAIQRVIYSESHDEVANGKARIPQEINPENSSDYFSRKRSTLAAGLVLTTPGIPMLFEGQEFLTDGWFRDDIALDWTKLGTYKGINRLYRDLLHLRRNLHGNTRGLIGPHVKVFHCNDEQKVIAFHRWQDGGPKDDVIVIASFANQLIEANYRIGLPQKGHWIIRFNSDWKGYSPDFSDISNPEGYVTTEDAPYDGYEQSAPLSIAPYGLIILSQE